MNLQTFVACICFQVLIVSCVLLSFLHFCVACWVQPAFDRLHGQDIRSLNLRQLSSLIQNTILAAHEPAVYECSRPTCLCRFVSDSLSMGYSWSSLHTHGLHHHVPAMCDSIISRWKIDLSPFSLYYVADGAEWLHRCHPVAVHSNYFVPFTFAIYRIFRMTFT